jgi:putative protease
MERIIGKVTHYFPKIGVAVVKLTDDINDGDQIRIAGSHSNFNQLVTSMQIEHKNIISAKKGQEIGMKVVQPVREGDLIYKMA